jgi:8-oxo-dGTP diphosphatase
VNLKISNYTKLFEYFNEFVHPRTDYYFLVTEFTGEIKVSAPEIFRQSRENIYRPEWISIEDLENINLQPEDVKKMLVEYLKKNK